MSRIVITSVTGQNYALISLDRFPTLKTKGVNRFQKKKKPNVKPGERRPPRNETTVWYTWETVWRKRSKLCRQPIVTANKFCDVSIESGQLKTTLRESKLSSKTRRVSFAGPRKASLHFYIHRNLVSGNGKKPRMAGI